MKISWWLNDSDGNNFTHYDTEGVPPKVGDSIVFRDWTKPGRPNLLVRATVNRVDRVMSRGVVDYTTIPFPEDMTSGIERFEFAVSYIQANFGTFCVSSDIKSHKFHYNTDIYEVSCTIENKDEA